MLHILIKEKLYHWAKKFWEKITGHKETIVEGWLARNKNGELFFYANCNKPKKSEQEWWMIVWPSEYTIVKECNEMQFPSVQWEDLEPTPCEMIIKIKK